MADSSSYSASIKSSSSSSVRSSDVKDKVSAILICRTVPGTESAKSGRSGEKYLASSELNHDLAALLRSGIKYKATGKVDGTCTLVQGGALLKRRDIKQLHKGETKKKQVIPADWIQTGAEGGASGHLIGFMPLDKGDKWHLDCHSKHDGKRDDKGHEGAYDMDTVNALDLNDTKTGLVYKQIPIHDLNGHSVEVMGPKFQSNPHHLKMHCVMRHGLLELSNFPDLSVYASESKEAVETKQDALSAIKHWFAHSAQGPYLEGVVLHLENGEMFKIHRHHLDLEWSADTTLPLDQIQL